MMTPRTAADWIDQGFQALWRDNERTLYRGVLARDSVDATPVLMVAPTEWSSDSMAFRLAHEHRFRTHLHQSWAVEPVDLINDGRALVLRDPGGTLLVRLGGSSLGIPRFLALASALTDAVRAMHEHGVLHLDLQPSNVFVLQDGSHNGAVRLTGFGLGKLLGDEREMLQGLHRPAGSFAYMAPEQTGRLDRAVDARADLYALGVCFFELLTGRLPLTADDPLGWIHSHLARQPPPVSEARADVPTQITRIIARLLEKNPDQRYFSARSLLADLEQCREQLSRHGRIASFPLAAIDRPLHVGLQGALYGREAELQTLRSALATVANTGERRVVCVSGYSGIGKSALVNRLSDDAWALDGFFASGKLDPYDRDTPYGALAAALRSLVRHVIGRDDEELARWREDVQVAVGRSGSLITRLVPEAKVLVGEDADIIEPSGLAARGHFLQVLRRFIAVFARRHRPLVLFIDDLQWLDAASLEVIESLATHPELHSLLLILAYRRNEVSRTSPAAIELERIRSATSSVIDIELAELSDDSAAHLIADSLQAPVEDLVELIYCILQKAGKNPFFLTHFLSALVEDGVIYFDAKEARWTWETERIGLMEVADNVGEILVDRLARLPPCGLEILQTFAALGNACSLKKLGIATGLDTSTVKAQLAGSVHAGLVLEAADWYQFAHDRIREATYAILTKSQRETLHGQIALRLQQYLDREGTEIELFEVATQWNRSTPSEVASALRCEIAALNLEAGRAARRTSAYQEASRYLAAGRQWLVQQEENERTLAFSLLLEHAECVFLGGAFDDTRSMLSELLATAQGALEFAAACRLKIELHVVQSEYEEALKASVAGLTRLGLTIDAPPAPQDVRSLYDDLLARLPAEPLKWIRNAPRMTDPYQIAAMRLLGETWPPAVLTDAQLTTAVACHLVNLTLLHGFTEASAQGFAVLGWLLGPVSGHYEQGYQLTLAAATAALERCTPVHSGRICGTTALNAPWTRTLEESVNWGRKAYQLLVDGGDVYYAAYVAYHVSSALLMRGSDLVEALEEVRKYLRFTADTGYRDGHARIAPFERAIACLRGETGHLSDLNQDGFDQARFEAEITAGNVVLIIQQYWATRTQLHFLCDEYEAAHEAAGRFVFGHYEHMPPISHLEHRYFTGLTAAALIARHGISAPSECRKTLQVQIDTIALWKARAGGPTFDDRLCLLQAEAARIDGEWLTAEQRYEESVRLARAGGFHHTEAIACERAAHFYRERQLGRIADMYLREAVEAYERWGAVAKVELLRAEHPVLRQRNTTSGKQIKPAEDFDLTSLLKQSQEVGNANQVDQLVMTLTRTAAELAGAQTAVLLLVRDNTLKAVAETFTNEYGLVVNVVRHEDGAVQIPNTVTRYVQRTAESLVVADAEADSRFSRDPRVIQHRIRSMLCLPVVRDGTTQAMLYLENNLAPHLFTASHVELLTLLATQCTISLENARLYADLQARESRIRRIFDLNVIGMVFWDLNGVLFDANDAFLEMLGRSRDELKQGLLRWYEMTPPEWQLQVPLEVQELKDTGALRPIEKEFFHRNGSRVQVLMSAAFFDETQQQGVAIIVDISKQKHAEARTIDAERRNRLLHAELAHAARVATMGHLAGWIAHDVKQPLAGIVASGNAALRWLKANPPNIAAAERATERTVRDAMRAASVLDRTRALVKKVSPEPDAIDVDAVILETLALVASEARHKQIDLQHDLQAASLKVIADQVQLQQVILNLVVNAMEALSSASGQDHRALLVTSQAVLGKQVVVSVSDNGPGLPTSREEDCFEAFFSTKAEGLGLGLSICRSIIESYGGSISAGPNLPRGATLRFVLPAAPSSG